MRYTVVLEQAADGGYVACVPALPGCVSQGDSRTEALANIREAIELYIEDCRDAGVQLRKRRNWSQASGPPQTTQSLIASSFGSRLSSYSRTLTLFLSLVNAATSREVSR